MGNKQDAIRYATIFLNTYCKLPADKRARLEEARDRVERLGGSDALQKIRVP
jgi:hypothetical protein